MFPGTITDFHLLSNITRPDLQISILLNGYQGSIQEKMRHEFEVGHSLPRSGIGGALPPRVPIHLHDMLLRPEHSFTCHFTYDVPKIVLPITKQTDAQKYDLVVDLTITCKLQMLYRFP